MSYYSLHPHAKRQAETKGFSFEAVLEAANDPTVSYDNGRFPGQLRRIRDGIVAVCDPEKMIVITVYENVKETAPRGDQRDRDALRYADTLAVATCPAQ